jgi:hypothetical protein
MKTAALVTSLTLGALLIPTEAEAIPLRQACRFGHHLHWTETEVKQTIRCAVERWPVPGGVSYALAIADRESSFYQRAENPSGARGIYQFMPRTWDVLRRRFPGVARVTADNPFYARANVLLAIRTAHAFGWGPWS